MLTLRPPSSYRLLIGLTGAPAAWVALMSIGNSMASYACFPHRVPLAAPLWGHLTLWLAALSVASLLAGAASGGMAFTAWKNTSGGRTRFLALLGLMSSGLFSAAILFTACALWLVPPCRPWL